jgi:hypothetical protein
LQRRQTNCLVHWLRRIPMHLAERLSVAALSLDLTCWRASSPNLVSTESRQAHIDVVNTARTLE